MSISGNIKLNIPSFSFDNHFVFIVNIKEVTVVDLGYLINNQIGAVYFKLFTSLAFVIALTAGLHYYRAEIKNLAIFTISTPTNCRK